MGHGEAGKYPHLTQDKILHPGICISIVYLQHLLQCTERWHGQRLQKVTPELSFWLWYQNLTGYPNCCIEISFRCIKEARWAHTGELDFAKCFQIPQLQLVKEGLDAQKALLHYNWEIHTKDTLLLFLNQIHPVTTAVKKPDVLHAFKFLVYVLCSPENRIFFSASRCKCQD